MIAYGDMRQSEFPNNFVASVSRAEWNESSFHTLHISQHLLISEIQSCAIRDSFPRSSSVCSVSPLSQQITSRKRLIHLISMISGLRFRWISKRNFEPL